jgi:glycosyltransferase involved in cell wall biosynthesis
MNNPRISIVIPTYFRDAMLAECLQSIVAQTIPIHEVVVVDDGGSGSARELVQQFGPRFRYLWQPNGGQPRARNEGARMSTGEWIAFLDDDDLWHPERHEIVAKLIATGQVDLISGDFTKFGDGWVASTGVFDEIAKQSPGFWDGIRSMPDSIYSIVGKFPATRLLPVYPFWPSTIVIRRDLFINLNGWNENLRGIRSEDNEFGFRAIKYGNLGLIWKSTVNYRSHSGNESNLELYNSIGRTLVWESLLTENDLTIDERFALMKAINETNHEIIYSAYSKKEYLILLNASAKIQKNDLSFAESIKILISKAFLYIKDSIAKRSIN